MEDPVQENPFPVVDPRGRAWETATHAAVEKLLRFEQKILEAPRPQSPAQDLLRLIELIVGKFQIWAERGLRVVQDHEDALAYEQWLDSYRQSWLRLMEDECPAGLQPDLVLRELNWQLLRVSKYWAANAFGYVAEQGNWRDAGEPQSRPLPTPSDLTIETARTQTSREEALDAPRAPGREPQVLEVAPAVHLLDRLLDEAESRTEDPKLRKKLIAVQLHKHYFNELKALKVACKQYQTPALLKKQFKRFDVWAVLDSHDEEDITAGKFDPSRFAWSLVKRQNGLAGKGDRTLKNYRKALKSAGITV